jgi:hypothetical protein
MGVDSMAELLSDAIPICREGASHRLGGTQGFHPSSSSSSPQI